MKKSYESPMTEFVELDTQNVLLGSWIGEDQNKEEQKDSSKLPEEVWS